MAESARAGVGGCTGCQAVGGRRPFPVGAKDFSPLRPIGGLENFEWLSGMAAMDTRCVHLHRTDAKKTYSLNSYSLNNLNSQTAQQFIPVR